ncbi:MAG: lytic transglycosylase domain-containing protein [Steroidobacteraceae bacterium]
MASCNSFASVLARTSFALLLALPAAANADQQRDAALRPVVAAAIHEAKCFADSFDSAVWYKMMEPRLRKAVADEAERTEILQQVFCEAHRPNELRVPPGLLMAIIDIESRFNRWAVSYAGAVGLMQVMPFWPEQLGMRRHELVRVGPNIRMGAAILRYYLRIERNDVQRALARYNGSVGRRWYSDKVIQRWSYWNGADDLGSPEASVSAIRK